MANKPLNILIVVCMLMVSVANIAAVPVNQVQHIKDPHEHEGYWVDVNLTHSDKTFVVDLTHHALAAISYVNYCSGGDDKFYALFPGSHLSYDTGEKISTVYTVAYWLKIERRRITLVEKWSWTTGNCFVSIGNMQLLTKGESFDASIGNYPCMLVTDEPASVDRQHDLCFTGKVWDDILATHPEWQATLRPDGGWVADNSPCAGPFGYTIGTNNFYGNWVCDGLMQDWHGK
jgi:hypothetical protein